jgi:hypothetical protein
MVARYRLPRQCVYDLAVTTIELAGPAEEAAAALAGLGYAADFSAASLAEIDRFFDDHSDDGRARPGGALDGDVGAKIGMLGAYVGEVLRRTLDGAWYIGSEEPVLHLGTGEITNPIQRVARRLLSRADSIAAYGRVYGLPTPSSSVPDPPDART